MAYPTDRLYTKDHEWIQISGDVGVVAKLRDTHTNDTLSTQARPIVLPQARERQPGRIHTIAAPDVTDAPGPTSIRTTSPATGTLAITGSIDGTGGLIKAGAGLGTLDNSAIFRVLTARQRVDPS